MLKNGVPPGSGIPWKRVPQNGVPAIPVIQEGINQGHEVAQSNGGAKGEGKNMQTGNDGGAHLTRWMGEGWGRMGGWGRGGALRSRGWLLT